MSHADRVFSGSIPEVYDTYLVPLIFEAFACEMAGIVKKFEPAAVLETAAGSGVVTRALAPLLSADARYVVSDLNQPMLERAATRQAPDPRIEWRVADAQELPFGEGEFDVVCCQFGVMFFPDRVRGYAQARRALKPGGAFVFNVWDAIEHNEFANCVTDAAAEVLPQDPPMFLARTPHGYHDTGLIGDELRKAGFSRIEISTVTRTSTAASARDPAIAYCQGTPLRNEIEARDPSMLETVTERASQSIAARFGNGPVAGRIQGHVIVAAP